MLIFVIKRAFQFC